MTIDLPNGIALYAKDAPRTPYTLWPVLCFACAVRAANSGQEIGMALRTEGDQFGFACSDCQKDA